MTEAEEKAFAEREALLAAWRTGAFFEQLLARVDKFGSALDLLAKAQRTASESVADDAAQMRLAAERAPAAQRASDIARDAAVLFVDRTTDRTKGGSADDAMRECVRLATIARELAEKQ